MRDLAGARVLVTGAAGFLGATLLPRLLRAGAQVHGVARPGTSLASLEEVRALIRMHEADVVDRDALRAAVAEARPDFVFHLAMTSGHAETPARRDAALRTSVLGTANLLEVAGELRCQRLVHFGSSMEYGPRRAPLTETDVPRPSSYRGAVRAAATLLCQQAAIARQVPVVVLRIFSVYGPWEPEHRLIPTAIRAALQGGQLPLTAPGLRRDLIFVDDVIEAALCAARAAGVDGEIVNVGSGQQWSNEEVVEMVQQVCGRRIRLRPGEYPPRPTDTDHWVADIAKARRLLGWSPRHDLRAGLEKMVAWVRTREIDHAAR